MVATRSQAAQDPLALFRALLCGDATAALDLLASSSARWLALVAPLGNLTVLHAAVLGDAAAALPQLAAACAAAGVSLDAQLEMEENSVWAGRRYTPMGRQLRDLGCKSPGQLRNVKHGATALAMAVCYEDVPAINILLQTGARAADSPQVAAMLFGIGCRRGVSWDQLLNPLLQHGLDPLGPAGPPLQQYGQSLLVHSSIPACGTMLAHLETQRAAGTLLLNSKHRCVQLLLGSCRCSHLPLQLVQHAVSQLEQLIGSQAAGGEDAAALSHLLWEAAAAGSPAVLSVLLASQLPWDVGAVSAVTGHSLLASAANSPQPAACVQLLFEAGALPTASDLYYCIDSLRPDGVAALLACGMPAVDTSQPTAVGSPRYALWSCPIHRTLSIITRHTKYRERRHQPALQVLEALRAAGYRPAVYTNASLPDFTDPDNPRMLPRLDPFDFYSLATSRDRGLPVAKWYIKYGGFPDWVLFAARDGSWSTATHRHWPAEFKAAVCALLLVASRGKGSSSSPPSSQHPRTARRQRRQAGAAAASGRQAGCTLGTLPAELLLRIVKAAAEPLSQWL